MNPKKALLLVAHGSRLTSSNEEIRVLTRTLAAAANGYELIGYAFLELAEPDIASGSQNLIQQGATELTIMPYFLVAGRHVVEDIPGEIENLRKLHPEIPIHITGYLGKSTSMVQLILEQVESAKYNRQEGRIETTPITSEPKP